MGWTSRDPEAVRTRSRYGRAFNLSWSYFGGRPEGWQDLTGPWHQAVYNHRLFLFPFLIALPSSLEDSINYCLRPRPLTFPFPWTLTHLPWEQEFLEWRGHSSSFRVETSGTWRVQLPVRKEILGRRLCTLYRLRGLGSRLIVLLGRKADSILDRESLFRHLNILSV